MLKDVLALIRKAGYKEIITWVLEENYPAKRFYEKNNFKITNDLEKTNFAKKEYKLRKYILS